MLWRGCNRRCSPLDDVLATDGEHERPRPVRGRLLRRVNAEEPAPKGGDYGADLLSRYPAHLEPLGDCLQSAELAHVASPGGRLVAIGSAGSDRVGASRDPQGLLAPELRRDAHDGALAQHLKRPRDRAQECTSALPEPAETGSLAKCEHTLGEAKQGPCQEMPE